MKKKSKSGAKVKNRGPINVNVSSSFMARSRCKECGSIPTHAYKSRLPFLWKDVTDIKSSWKWFRQWVHKFNNDWSMMQEEPRIFRDIEEFNFVVDDRGYNPRPHKNRFGPRLSRDYVTEFVGCRCGATVWAFNQKSVETRPEIVNRKGRHSFPRRFDI
jgi:hypothetical protein